jgi:hypothetical protein
MSDIPGLVEALEPVARIFQAMRVNFYVGGSVASSFHGASRSTLDVDLVADLKPKDVDPFVSHLEDQYYVSKDAIRDAIKRLSCFNLIHLGSAFKVDIFILKSREFDKVSMARAELGKVDPTASLEVPIATPEDMILSKLEWYRLGNEVSDRQWEDVTRVMKILGDQADLEYMKRIAVDLNVADLLQKLHRP